MKRVNLEQRQVLGIVLVTTLLSLMVGYYLYPIFGVNVGDVSTFYLDRGPRYEASYVVGVWNSTHYYAMNGTTGQREYLSDNASYIIQGVVTSVGSVGGKILLKTGVYLLDSSITLSSYITLEGEVMARTVGYTVPFNNGTVLRVDNGADITPILFEDNARYVTIKNLIIDGNSPQQTSTTIDGINGDKASGTALVGVTIENVGIFYTMRHAVYLNYTYVSTIKKCYILWTGRNERQESAAATAHGLYLNHFSDGWILYNDVEIGGYDADSNSFIGDSGSALYLNGGNNLVEGNNLAIYREYGLFNNGGQNRIFGNRIDHNGERGIYCYSSTNPIITGNDVSTSSRNSSGSFDGIYLDDADNALLSDNRVWDYESPQTQRYGIYITGNTANATIALCNTQNAGTEGIIDAGTGTHVNLCWNGTVWIP